MILTASREEAAARRQRYVTPGGALTFVSTYLGTNKMELLAQGRTLDAAALASQPMAYLVEQAPDATVHAHYHQVDQFQLFTGGQGRIGTHALEGLGVHYAGAHSPYGPIVAGPEGVQYMTLRPGWDPGAQWMPEAAAALRDLPGRQHVAFTSEPLVRRGDLRDAGDVTFDTVMPRQAGGACASLVRAGAGRTVPLDTGEGGPLFWYVLAGSVTREDRTVAADGCLYCPADEPASRWRAGADGVELVQVQFARK